jgi:hypothetical protein
VHCLSILLLFGPYESIAPHRYTGDLSNNGFKVEIMNKGRRNSPKHRRSRPHAQPKPVTADCTDYEDLFDAAGTRSIKALVLAAG